MIKITQKGNFNNTEKFLKSAKELRIIQILNEYGKKGVDSLSLNTPINTGETASLWNYEIHVSKDTYKLIWTNDSMNDGIPIVILLQYGHATKNGGYIEGTDFINPAIKPIFDEITNELWREVTKA